MSRRPPVALVASCLVLFATLVPAAQATPASSSTSGSTSEWARFLFFNLVQGEIQETLHPNFYGQQALGRCLSVAVNASPGRGACRPTTGQGPEGMVYSR